MDPVPALPAQNTNLADGVALAEAGDTAGAEAVFRAILARRPADQAAQRQLVTLLLGNGRPGDVLAEMAAGLLQGQENTWLLRAKMRACIAVGYLAGARQSFYRAAETAATAGALLALIDVIRPLFHRWQHPIVLTKLSETLDQLRNDGLADKAGQSAILAMRLRIALRDYHGFLAIHHQAPAVPQPWQDRFAQAAAILRRRKIPDFEGEKIFGIGLSKTGTMSLAAALRELGYLTAHYTNVFSAQMLTEEDAFVFDAMCDTPVAVRFETLYHLFPNARFIYTRRAFTDWLPSFEAHCRRGFGTTDFAAIRLLPLKRQAQPSISDFESVDCTLYFRHPDAAAAVQAHDARIRNFFRDKPAGKLLEYDVFAGAGWPELCGFLDRPIPASGYPWENRR